MAFDKLFNWAVSIALYAASVAGGGATAVLALGGGGLVAAGCALATYAAWKLAGYWHREITLAEPEAP